MNEIIDIHILIFNLNRFSLIFWKWITDWYKARGKIQITMSKISAIVRWSYGWWRLRAIADIIIIIIIIIMIIIITTSLQYLNGLYQQYIRTKEYFETLELIGCWFKCLAYLIRRRQCRQYLISLTFKK